MSEFKTGKDLELSLLLKEKQIQDLKLEKIKLIENGLKLRKRIDKATEYIKENINFKYSDKFIEKIVDILQGSDKHEF